MVSLSRTSTFGLTRTLTVDLWPLTLRIFRAISSHTMNICGKFHWNPSTKYGDIASCKIGVDGQRPDRWTDGQNQYQERPSAIVVCQFCRQCTRPRYGDWQQIINDVWSRHCALLVWLLPASSAATGGQSTPWSSGQDPSPGVYILSARLLQHAALWYHRQLVSVSAVDPECSGATCDGHQVAQPQLTSSVTFALVASEAMGRLQTGYIGLQVAARLNPFVPRWWPWAHRWLWTPSSALSRCQRSHCSVDLHLARRQEFSGVGPKSMEQSSRHTAKTEHQRHFRLARLRRTSDFLFIMRRV